MEVSYVAHKGCLGLAHTSWDRTSNEHVRMYTLAAVRVRVTRVAFGRSTLSRCSRNRIYSPFVLQGRTVKHKLASFAVIWLVQCGCGRTSGEKNNPTSRACSLMCTHVIIFPSLSEGNAYNAENSAKNISYSAWCVCERADNPNSGETHTHMIRDREFCVKPNKTTPVFRIAAATWAYVVIP